MQRTAAEAEFVMSVSQPAASVHTSLQGWTLSPPAVVSHHVLHFTQPAAKEPKSKSLHTADFPACLHFYLRTLKAPRQVGLAGMTELKRFL